jgi:N-acetylmuramoyl-L-alanine amidase
MNNKNLAKITLSLFVLTALIATKLLPANQMSGAPPYGEPESSVPQINDENFFQNWKRPNGPARVGLQVGHWKNEELPDELSKLRGSTGATGGGKYEWEVNLAIAEKTAELLRAQGIVVDILPATIPENYWADVFLAIHADGSLDSYVSGYKIAPPWRDYTRSARRLVEILEISYEEATKLSKDPNISRNMRGYYAFSWWRYNHAIHNMTTAAIIETGFLTNYSDRQLIVNNPEISAAGISAGIMKYLEEKKLVAY